MPAARSLSLTNCSSEIIGAFQFKAVSPPGEPWPEAVPLLLSCSTITKLSLIAASGSVIGLKLMLDADEPLGDQTAGSVPEVKKTNRYLALPAAACAGWDSSSDRNGENSAVSPRCLVKSRRL